MFGDGVKDKVIGKENMSKPRLLILKNVKLVKGLSTNLISQLCDEGFNVKFLKGRCLVTLVTDRDETLIMTGTRSDDNYYLWTPNIFKSGCSIPKYYEFVPATKMKKNVLLQLKFSYLGKPKLVEPSFENKIFVKVHVLCDDTIVKVAFY